MASEEDGFERRVRPNPLVHQSMSHDSSPSQMFVPAAISSSSPELINELTQEGTPFRDLPT